MKNSILLLFFFLTSTVYAQNSEGTGSIKHKTNGVFISIDGFIGKSSSKFEPNWSGSFSFQSGILVGYRLKYLKFGVGVYNQQYSKSLEYNTTDFLGNITGKEKVTITSNYIVPSIQVSSNILESKKFYPFIGLNYQLPVILSLKGKSTSEMDGLPFTEKRSDLKNDSLFLKVGQNLKINSGVGFRINKVFSLEAILSYCHFFKGLESNIKSNSKSPYILGGQISAVFNFNNRKN